MTVKGQARDPKGFTHGACGAKTRAGTPCKQPALSNGRCRLHGGLSLAGVMSPTFKHGRYSKHMPKGMLPAYQESLSDPDLLALMDQIALIDSRIVGLLDKLGTRESGAAWIQLQGLWREFDMAMRRGDAEEIQVLRVDIDRIIRQGVGEVAQWEELGRQIDRLTRLKKDERDRRVQAQQLVKADQVLSALIALVETTTTAVRKHTDVPTGKIILEEVARGYELVTGKRTSD